MPMKTSYQKMNKTALKNFLATVETNVRLQQTYYAKDTDIAFSNRHELAARLLTLPNDRAMPISHKEQVEQLHAAQTFLAETGEQIRRKLSV